MNATTSTSSSQSSSPIISALSENPENLPNSFSLEESKTSRTSAVLKEEDQDALCGAFHILYSNTLPPVDAGLKASGEESISRKLVMKVSFFGAVYLTATSNSNTQDFSIEDLVGRLESLSMKNTPLSQTPAEAFSSAKTVDDWIKREYNKIYATKFPWYCCICEILFLLRNFIYRYSPQIKDYRNFQPSQESLEPDSASETPEDNTTFNHDSKTTEVPANLDPSSNSGYNGYYANPQDIKGPDFKESHQ